MTAKTGKGPDSSSPKVGALRFRFLALGSVFALLVAIAASGQASAAVDKVLILDSTVGGGGQLPANSLEATYAASLGFTVDIVNAATWGSMTTSDFAGYRAIILGDPTCSSAVSNLAAPTGNASTWAAATTGNVIVVGTDPVWHSRHGGKSDALTKRGIDFAVADAGKTGAYITLSCYYGGSTPNTPVPALSGFGSFAVRGACGNNVKIVATHPALSGLTEASLSNWSCSIHEAFDSWPISFEVLAMSVGTGTAFTAPDGTQGTPYIVARGVEVISDINLSPDDATSAIGISHTVTATVNEDETPVVGATVNFSVIAGPHLGETGAGTTGTDGMATFSYTGTVPGIDTIEATFVDSLSRTQRSNRVSMTWEPDDDGDGVSNGDDDCEDTVLDALVDADGCSASQLDDDGDLISNLDDDCANTPTGELVGTDGCPLPVDPETGPGPAPIRWTLDVTAAGNGTGSITGSGIDCPGDCTQSYVSGTSVTLTGLATGGSSFSGWSQDCSGMSTCQLMMSADHLATGTFELPQSPDPQTQPSPTPTPPPPPSLPGTCRGHAITIQVTNANETTFGTAGIDVINGTSGSDKIYGYGRGDIICGRGGGDLLYGGGGDGGGLFPDKLYGGAGNDRLFGDGGDDILVGGPGDDHLYGSPGDDVLNGGAGTDTCKGGAGFDTGKLCEPFDQ